MIISDNLLLIACVGLINWLMGRKYVNYRRFCNLLSICVLIRWCVLLIFGNALKTSYKVAFRRLESYH